MKKENKVQSIELENVEANVTDQGGASMTILSEDQEDKPTLKDFDFN